MDTFRDDHNEKAILRYFFSLTFSRTRFAIKFKIKLSPKINVKNIKMSILANIIAI